MSPLTDHRLGSGASKHHFPTQAFEAILTFMAINTLLMSVALAWSGPTRFEFKDAGLRNLFYVVSDALLEKFVASSNAVDGWIEINPHKVKEGVRGLLTVDLRTLETGHSGYNELIQSKVMAVFESPVLTFEFAKLLGTTSDILKKDVPTVLKLDGTLKWKGQSKGQVLFLRTWYMPASDITNQRLPGNLLKVGTTFDLDLANFGLLPPDINNVKVASVLQTSFDAVATDVAASTMIIGIPEGPKPKEGRANIQRRTPASEELTEKERAPTY